MAEETTSEAPAAESAPAIDGDNVTTALAEVTNTNTSIVEHLKTAEALAERYKGVAFNVSTTKGYDEACKARAELREHRYAIQNLQPTVSKMLGTMQRNFNRWCEKTAARMELEFEKPIHDQIVAEDQRKAREKAEREAEEQKRRQGHAEAINAISQIALSAVGLTGDEIQEKLEAAKGIIVDEGYEEFQGQAQQAKDEAIRQLQGMLTAARLDEQERRELEEARQRQAVIAAQQEEARKQAEAKAAEEAKAREKAEAEAQKLREKVAAMERAEQERLQAEAAAAQERARADRERAEAIRVRIDAIRTAGDPLDDGTSLQLTEAIEFLNALEMSGDFYGERLAEALQARDERVRAIAVALIAAQQREAAEEAAAQAARVQELIDNIVIMGDKALLAVQDGSADLGLMRQHHADLREMIVTMEVFGDRAHEVQLARGHALQKIEEAIAATEERDRLAAEEAERQRIEREQQMAAIALADAKRSHGEELYEMVRLVACMPVIFTAQVASYGPLKALVAQSRALLLKINPNENFEDDNHA